MVELIVIIILWLELIRKWMRRRAVRWSLMLPLHFIKTIQMIYLMKTDTCDSMIPKLKKRGPYTFPSDTPEKITRLKKWGPITYPSVTPDTCESQIPQLKKWGPITYPSVTPILTIHRNWKQPTYLKNDFCPSKIESS